MRLLVLVGLLAACGDNVRGVAAKDFQTAFATAVCEQSVRCGIVDDMATCLAVWPPQLDPSWVAAIDAGKMIYNAAQAQECVDLMANASCARGERLDRSSACDGITHGRMKAGETCSLPYECASEDCAATLRDGCYTGTCAGNEPRNPRLAIGEPCELYSECLDGFCDLAINECVPWLGIGAACSEDQAYQCATGWCVNHRCARLPDTGEACAVSGNWYICGNYGDYCELATLTCVPVGLTGAPCASSYECAPAYACNDGECRLRPWEGDPCDGSYNDPARTCVGFTRCVAGICTAGKTDGDTCTASYECASNYCDATHVCAQPPICI